MIEIIKKTIRSMFEDCKPVTNVNDRENNNWWDCVLIPLLNVVL